jgi:hypothetical protein
MNQNTELPRKGSVVYDIVYGNEKQKRIIIKKFKFINTFFILLYRIGLLPLLGFGQIFLLFINFGRISDKKYIIPLEYHRIDGIIHIFSARGSESDWFKNLIEKPNKVSVKLGFRSYKPKVEIIHDPKDKLEIIKWYVNTHPNAAKQIFGWNRKTDDPESDILEPLVDLIQIIKLHKMN